MNRTTAPWRIGLAAAVCASLMLACLSAFGAKEPPPQVSEDGLQLQKSTKSRLVYVKPGATFSQYNRVAILDCYVEFEKNWQRDYNQDVVGTQGRVTDKDVERIKKDLAAEFKKVFTEELEKGGYQVVTTAAPDVLVLRPALVNVKATAPDMMTAGMNAIVVDSAGQMTLFLELWDSTSNTILARAMDAQADDQPFAQPANRVTNKAAADRILREWADALRSHLDAVRGKAVD
jgi:hypothetical protein